MGRSKATNHRAGNSGSAARSQLIHSFAHRNQQDIQHAINFNWSTLPEGSRTFFADTDHDMNLHKLIEFWRAQLLDLQNQAITSTMCGSTWYLALCHLRLGKNRAARNLLICGGFLQEAFRTSMNDIILAANSPHAGSHNLLTRFNVAYEKASMSPALMEVFLKKAMPQDYQRMMNFASKTAHGPVSEYVNYISSDWNEKRGNSRASSSNNSSNEARPKIRIVLLDDLTKETCELCIERSTTLKSLFNEYAEVRDASLRSLRFSYEGQTLFLSSAKNKTPEDLGMNDLDTIHVIDLTQTSRDEETVTETVSTLKDSPSRPKRGQKSKRRAQPTATEKTKEDLRIEHSKILTKMHEEAQPRFKKIRQRLNNLSIERLQPKIKSRRPRFVPPLPQTIISNPNTAGLGGKAGKPKYVVQVGEVQNLYKTSKLRRGGVQASTTFQAISIDLHGHTKAEAIKLLNDKLPMWNDIAMSGSYPFVMPVEIICGCGNQVLSEAVGQWIKCNEKVSNAPKNMWVPQQKCPYPYAA
ncbi:hypothetical protein ACHAXR_005609 [Thalassiosira sp. AJA248-18]